MMPEPVITVEHLKRDFTVRERAAAGFIPALKAFFKPVTKRVTAVNDVSFTIERGEIRGLIGPNGAGKSTIIKMLSGVLYPSGGSVNSLGFVPWRDRRDYVRKIGVLFGQKTQLLWALPALDAFELNKAMFRVPNDVFRKRLDYFSGLLGIGDLIKKPVRQLSLGERMKCELVVALLHDPELIFLDEPTIGLDILSKETFRKFILDVNRERKTTFIVTTHDLSDIENLCDSVTIINKGVKVFDGSLEDLTAYFAGRKVFALDFSTPVPEADFAGLKVIEYGAHRARIEIEMGGRPIKEVVSGFFERFPVKDISITSIPIEEVVKDIYRK
jgi:ABC-2 type transport system ATP-binding protein